MRFEWDENKNRLNKKKHGVSFERAKEVFADPFCLTIRDRTMEGEQRFWTIGRLHNLAIVVVAHTTRDSGGEVTRIISARRATPRERRYYEEIDK
jgi:uncharacterized protein